MAPTWDLEGLEHEQYENVIHDLSSQHVTEDSGCPPFGPKISSQAHSDFNSIGNFGAEVGSLLSITPELFNFRRMLPRTEPPSQRSPNFLNPRDHHTDGQVQNPFNTDAESTSIADATISEQFLGPPQHENSLVSHQLENVSSDIEPLDLIGIGLPELPFEVEPPESLFYGKKDESFPPDTNLDHNQKDGESIEQDAESKVVAFIKTWAAQFPGTFPSGEQIVALAKLTSLNPKSIENDFGREIVSPISEKSDISLPTFCKIQSTTPSLEFQHTAKRQILKEAAQWVAEQPTKCRPYHNMEEVETGLSGIYKCTLGCNRRFVRKDVWKKHEEKRYPQEGYICDLGTVVLVRGILTCTYCGARDPDMNHVSTAHPKQIALGCHQKSMGCGRIFYRKEHFVNHLKRVHPSVPHTESLNENQFTVQARFPKQCIFCPNHHFHDWDDRIEHLAAHFEAGAAVAVQDFQSASEGIFDIDQIQEEGDFNDEDFLSLNDTGNLKERDETNRGFEKTSDFTTSHSAPACSNCSFKFQDHESIHTAPAIPNDLKSTQIRSLIPAPFNTAPAVPDFISSSSGMIVLQAVMRCINNWTLHPALKAVKGIQTKISGKYNENIGSQLDVSASAENAMSAKPSHPKVGSPNSQLLKNTEQPIYGPDHQIKRFGIHTLRERLLDSRISEDEYNFFIPVDALYQIITEDSISQELSVPSPIETSLEYSNIVQKVHKRCRKLFAILTIIQKSHTITDFLAEELSDIDLPFRRSRVEKENNCSTRILLQSPSGRLVSALIAWCRWDIEEFSRVQGWFATPVFSDRAPHCGLDDNCILPLIPIDKTSPKTCKGRYSEVFPVNIHSAHHIFWEREKEAEEPLVAIKKLPSPNEIEFRKETTIPRPLGACFQSKPVAIHFCPVLACKRHRQGFVRIWNMRKHLREIHGRRVLESFTPHRPIVQPFPVLEVGELNGGNGHIPPRLQRHDDLTQEVSPRKPNLQEQLKMLEYEKAKLDSRILQLRNDLYGETN